MRLPGLVVAARKGVDWAPSMVEVPDDETLDELLAPWERGRRTLSASEWVRERTG